jgi:N-acetylmuramoyl-L-alanine amidase
LLKNGKSFVFNRFYLLLTFLLCLSSPLFQIETSFQSPLVSELSTTKFISENNIIEENIQAVTVETINKPFIVNPIPHFAWVVYLLISAVFLVRFSRNLIQINKNLEKTNPVIDGLQLVLLENETNPFSFFNYLFVNKKQFQDGKLTPSIISHEKIHSRQLHTIDTIIIEFILCLFWFNPFIWLYKKAISENHEYLTDDIVVNEGVDVTEYSKEIIQAISITNTLQLVSGFSYLQTKNRLIMLGKSKSNKFMGAIKIISVFILFGTLLSLNAFTYKDSKPLVVVIDAGHGGEDEGIGTAFLTEKEIALSIAQKLYAYNQNNKIKILLTRADDKFITLQNRVDYINEQKPDLFISLHVNMSENTDINGLEAFFYEGNHQTESKNYCKILLSEQLKCFPNEGRINTGNFHVLKNSNCPGILLEMGYLGNKYDSEILNDIKNHDKIAASIYNGLIEISKAKQ